jgi:hypothetical protein
MNLSRVESKPATVGRTGATEHEAADQASSGGKERDFDMNFDPEAYEERVQQ